MTETMSRDTLDPHYDGSPRSAAHSAAAHSAAGHRAAAHSAAAHSAAAHRVTVHRPGAPRPVMTQVLPIQRPSSPPPSERTASTRRTPQAALRLTRRGRLTVVLATIALLLAAFSAGHVMSNASSGPATAPATHTVVVSPGDTFWSLARASMPHVDGRAAVDRLMAMNHSDGTLQVGQTLVVPGS